MGDVVVGAYEGLEEEQVGRSSQILAKELGHASQDPGEAGVTPETEQKYL